MLFPSSFLSGSLCLPSPFVWVGGWVGGCAVPRLFLYVCFMYFVNYLLSHFLMFYLYALIFISVYSSRAYICIILSSSSSSSYHMSVNPLSLHPSLPPSFSIPPSLSHASTTTSSFLLLLFLSFSALVAAANPAPSFSKCVTFLNQ